MEVFTPKREQTLLGIEWTFAQDALFASPGAKRIKKLQQSIQQFFDGNRMSAQSALCLQRSCALLAPGCSTMSVVPLSASLVSPAPRQPGPDSPGETGVTSVVSLVAYTQTESVCYELSRKVESRGAAIC